MLDGSCDDSDQGFTMAVIEKKIVTGNVEMRNWISKSPGSWMSHLQECRKHLEW